MEYFIGGIGKENSWCLVSDCPFIAEDRRNNKFISVKTIEDAAKYYEEDGIYVVYAWNLGVWNKINFLTISDKPSTSIGFRPPEKASCEGREGN